MTKQIRWIIQNNLIAETDLEKMRISLKEHNIDFFEVMVIPFDDKIPIIPIGDDTVNIYYGSISFIDNCQRNFDTSKGVFFSEETFSMENYLKHWKDYMLNSDAIKTTFGKFVTQNYTDESLWFFRPDADDKSFNGEVRRFLEIKNIFTNITKCDTITLDSNTKIIASTPYNVAKEWRNFIVNGKIVSSTLYRKNFKLSKSAFDIPEEMLNFVRARIAEYQPHEIFCMDVCLCGDSYYIIECGCVNSCGFYHADISKVILEISRYVKNLKIC